MRKGGKKRVGVKILTLQLSHPQGVKVGEKFQTCLEMRAKLTSLIILMHKPPKTFGI